MNKSIKTFACATVASMLLLACNISGDGENSPPQATPQKGGQAGDPNPLENAYTPGMVCTEGMPVVCYPVDKPPYDPSSEPPYNPNVVIIDKDVEEWLASNSGEKRLIHISDMYMPETTPPGLSAIGSSNEKGEYSVEYFLNGEKISAEEYNRKWVEYESQRTDRGKRNLSIPGEIRLDLLDSPYGWVVLMTAEELAELLKEYDKLAIEFYREYTNDV